MAATAAEQISNAPKSPLHHAGDKVSPRAPDKPSTPFKPPDTLPIEIPIPEIRSAFQSAVTGDLESDLKNNASLQAEDITNLARQTYKNPTTKQTSFVLRSSFFSVEYELMDEHNLEDRVFVNITNCEDAFTAQKMMADYLGMFQADVSMVTKRSEKELGQVALQTEKGVFWVRDAMWIQLWEEKARRERVKTIEDALSGRVSNRAAMHLMLRFAVRIDSYLAEGAVLPALQRKPETKVDTSKCRAVYGESFIIKLGDPSHTRKFSQVEVENPSIVVQTENKDLDTKEVYTFFANKPGQTRIKIMVARADNFATGTAEVQVEIKDR